MGQVLGEKNDRNVFARACLSCWNDVVGNGKIASEETRNRLDYEIPAYLPRLRRAINQSMDPHYTPPKEGKKLSILRFLELGRATMREEDTKQ